MNDEITLWRTRLADSVQVRVLDTVEADRAVGGPACAVAYCGHTEAEHRDTMFTGHLIPHDWCFTCHHVLSYLGDLTREQAHHAFLGVNVDTGATT